MNKPSRPFAKPLREFAGKVVGATFTRQGFATAELVTRWSEIVGAEIAACSEPIKIQWTRPVSPPQSTTTGGRGSGFGQGQGHGQEPGTLVLRVDGPAAIEVQHLTNVICERVNAFLGWRAVARVGLRQAPLRRGERKAPRTADAAAAARIAATLPDIVDDDLRQAVARLGAAIKRP